MIRTGVAASRVVVPRLVPAVVATTAGLALLVTLLCALVLGPAVVAVGAGLSELVLFGVLLLMTSLLRMTAGLFAARAHRRRHGTDTRTELLLSVLTGAAVAWAVYAGLVVTASGLTGTDGDLGRLLLELPRWLVEGAAGAVVVTPGDRERLDPRLRRFAGPGHRP